MGESKHEHGKMDITVQERAFAAFVKITANSIIGIAVLLILLYLING